MVQPQNTVLVIDAAMGQESVNVAETFNDRVGLTGLILTKLDGDARGGAALSVQQVVGVPIHYVGVGEKTEDLEVFHPDRLAGRILGMGDVVGLVEKAAEMADMDDMEGMESMAKRMMSGKLNFEDMLSQMQQMKKMGSINKIMDMMPGMPKVDADEKAKMAEQGEVQSKRFEAIILSMTVPERRKPNLMNAKRKQRIAKGSGNPRQRRK